MLARRHRFFGFGSVKPVLKSGISVRQGFFTIRALKRRCDPEASCPSRAAVVVSRRAAKSAVVRNRIRRRVYARLGESWTDLATPVDVAVIVHDARLADWPSAQLSQALQQTLQAALTKLS